MMKNNTTPRPTVQPFFHAQSHTISYVVHDGHTAAIIDPVLDFDMTSGRTNTPHADAQIAYINKHALTLEWLLETHAHADHISAAPYIKHALGGQIAIGEHIKHVQTTFASVFNDKSLLEDRFHSFDKTFTDGQTFKIGTLNAQFVHTPGHTEACGMYVIENSMAFVGDTLFMPDAGTARCDFPGGCAKTLYTSITQKIYALPDATILFICHDYGASGTRPIAWQTTVKAQKANNIHLKHNTPMAHFVNMRTKRDKTLSLPALIIPSVQLNIRAGRKPEPEDNGTQYLKIPLNKF